MSEEINYMHDRFKQKLYGKAYEPKKVYYIPKVSAKRKLQIADDKILFEQDKEFYREVWNASPHICQCGCKRYLGKEPLTTFFHHLLPKSVYPQFRHTFENIMILHPEDHSQVESNVDRLPEVRRRQDEARRVLLPNGRSGL